MHLRPIALPALTLTLVALVAGCGGGSGDTSTVAVSMAQFVKSADAICEKATEKVGSDLGVYLKKKHFSIGANPTNAQATGLVNDVLAPDVEKEVDELRALGAPSGDEDEVEAIVVAVEGGLERARKSPKAVVQGELDLFGEASELARNYGLKACGER